MDFVVPVTVKRIPLQSHAGEFLVVDLGAGWITAGIDLALGLQSPCGGRRGAALIRMVWCCAPLTPNQVDGAGRWTPRGEAGRNWGIANPCPRAFSAFPCGRGSRPAFLKSPTNSFFFVSTEITGCLLAKKRRTLRLMYSNCAFRSGCSPPSVVLRFA